MQRRIPSMPCSRSAHSRYLAALRVGFLLMLAASFRLASAQGGPPLVTDDPDTPGDGKWEINLASIGCKTFKHWEVHALDADINYGLGDRIQLKLDIPWTYVHDSDKAWHSGLGSVNAGVKWRFIDKDETHGFAIS